MKWLTCSSADHLETMNRTLHLRSRGDSGVVPKPCVHMKSGTGDHNYVHHYFFIFTGFAYKGMPFTFKWNYKQASLRSQAAHEVINLYEET